MNDHDHERAIDLIIRNGIDETTPADAAWLDSHLAQCSECADYAEAFERAGQLLRSVAVTASPALVSTTQARVHARAAQLREHHARVVLVTVSFCIGVLASTASAWVWWKVGGWVAGRLSLPASLVAPGILFFWLLPAVVIAILMLAFPHPVIDTASMLSAARGHEGEER